MSYTEEQKKKAQDALFGLNGGSTKAKAVEEEVPEVEEEFPNILPTDGTLYSTLFPEYYDERVMKDFIIPHWGELPEWVTPYIPTSSDYLGEMEVVYQFALGFALKSVTHLVGFPGTGKSEGLPVFMAHRLKLPLLRLGLNKKGMGLDDLIGRESIDNEGGVSVTRHRDGILCKWITIPSIILADEFSRASVEISNGLMSLMENPNGKLIVENRADPIIVRSKDCWLIASDNVKGTGDTGVGMIGTDQVDGAILDRFEKTIEVDYLPPDKAAALLKKSIPGFPAKEARIISLFGTRVQKAYKEGRLPVSFSQRSARAIAREACVTKNLSTSVKYVFLNRFDADDKTFIAAMWKDVSGEDL